MGLTAAQRKRLKREGWSSRDISEIGDLLAEDDEDEDEDRGRRRKSSRDDGEVTVLRGNAARAFLDKLGAGDDDEGDDDEGDEGKPKRKAKAKASEDEGDDDEDEGDDEDDDVQDERPPEGHRYFRGGR